MLERFKYYEEMCAQYGVRPDFAKYSGGRVKGLELFCTRSMGYSEGREGREYRDVCSESSEGLFLEGHSLGYRVHSTEELVESIDREMRPVSRQIESLANEIANLESAPDLDTYTDRDIRSQLSALRQDLKDANDQIKPLQERRIDAVIEYREAVEEANANGFGEVVDEEDDNELRDENADP